MQRRKFLQLGLAAALGALGEPGACAATPDVAHLGGRVVLRGQSGYDAARQDHNARIGRAPAVMSGDLFHFPQSIPLG